MLGLDQEVLKQAAAAVAVHAPMPEETAWSMIAAEGGILAVVLATGVIFLWRVVSRFLNESSAHSKELMKAQADQSKELMKAQADSIAKLSEAVLRVENAVRLSDANNQHAIGRLSDTVASAVARIDRHEVKLEVTTTHLMEHSHRIQALETGSHRILPAVPGNPR